MNIHMYIHICKIIIFSYIPWEHEGGANQSNAYILYILMYIVYVRT